MFGRVLAPFITRRLRSSTLSTAKWVIGEETNLIIESLRIVVRPARVEEVRRAFAAWIGPTQVESGCINLRILQETGQPHSFCYQAEWANQDDLMRHLRSEHYKRLLLLMDLGDEPPVVEFHTVTETKGLDLIQHARNVFLRD
jgi:quinol monooxygenase YgiN